MSGKYDDIIDLPHPSSAKHPRMSMADRAAQFSPFSALIGYEQAIQESSRLTQAPCILTEEEQELLDRKLRLLHSQSKSNPPVQLVVYVPDQRKEGGSFQVLRGRVQRIDPLQQCLLLTDGRIIPMGRICSLDIEEQDTI